MLAREDTKSSLVFLVFADSGLLIDCIEVPYPIQITVRDKDALTNGCFSVLAFLHLIPEPTLS